MTPLLAHLEQQVASARRLLGIVLAQGEAIRRQDVSTLLARLGDLQTEVAARQRLELERDGIVRGAAARLGLPLDAVDLDALLTLGDGGDAESARTLSAELRGLLDEVRRAHETNRVLLRQELSFLDHLLRLMSGAPQGSYSPNGWTEAPLHAVAAVDMRA